MGHVPTLLRSPFAHAVKVSTATEAPPEAKEVLSLPGDEMLAEVGGHKSKNPPPPGRKSSVLV